MQVYKVNYTIDDWATFAPLYITVSAESFQDAAEKAKEQILADPRLCPSCKKVQIIDVEKIF